MIIESSKSWENKNGQNYKNRHLKAIFPNYCNASNTLKQVQLHPLMAFRYEWNLFEYKICNWIEGFSSFQNVLIHEFGYTGTHFLHKLP